MYWARLCAGQGHREARHDPPLGPPGSQADAQIQTWYQIPAGALEELRWL